MSKKVDLDYDAMERDPLVEVQTIVIDPKQEPIRIDRFLMDRVQQISRNRLQNAITDGSVTVDGKVVKPNHKVKPYQEVKLYIPRPNADRDWVAPEPMDLDVRYEDDDLMVIYKPAGLVVHPGIGNHSGTLVNGLMHYFKSRNLPVMEGNEPDRPGLVHRIDKDTTGLMVIAKNEASMTALAKQFFDHSIERTYQAIVWSGFDEQEGTIEGHIGRHPRERMLQCVFPHGEEGKHAVTHYKVLEDLYYVSLVECRLETGRTHQIRVHMRHIGHTLFNDERYGGNRVLKGTVYSKYRVFVERTFDMIPRTALHAKTLGFIHPTTGEKMVFDTDLPDDMQKVLDRWRAYVSTRK